MTELLNPRTDIVFRMLFVDPANRRLLIALLNAILQPERPIVSVEVLNPEPVKDTADGRGVVLDLLVQFEGGERANVEMQTTGEKHLEGRALLHWARIYADTIARGESFAQLRPCHVIFILAYDPGWTDTHLHERYRVRSERAGRLWSRDLALHTVELRKLGVPGASEPGDGQLLDWARFLAAETDEERRRLAMSNPDIDEANEALERLSADKYARWAALRREHELASHRDDVRDAREQGQREGREQGQREGRLVAIRALCEAFHIDLGHERSESLEAMSSADLDALLETLKRERRWPK